MFSILTEDALYIKCFDTCFDTKMYQLFKMYFIIIKNEIVAFIMLVDKQIRKHDFFSYLA